MIPPPRSILRALGYIKGMASFSPLVLVLIRQLFRSLHCPGDGLKKTLEIFEGFETAQTR